MEKNGRNLGMSAFILLISGIVCKALGALFRLPLTNLLGIEGIGVFQLVMSLFSFALVVTCGGVTNSLSKLISSARAKGEDFKIKAYLSRAVFSGLVIGLGLGVAFLLLSRHICAFQGIDAATSYMLFLVLLPLGAGLAALRGFFQGYENMFPTAISQVLEQVVKFALGLAFAYLFGRAGLAQGVFGAFLGIALSEVVALAYLCIVFFVRSLRRVGKEVASGVVEASKEFFADANLSKFLPQEDMDKKSAKRTFDRANLPLTLSASILPLVNAFDGLVIVARLSLAGFSNAEATQLFGLQNGVVGAILNFPLVISIAVTTTLLPNISFLISRGTGGKHIIERGLKVLLFLILPTTFGIVAISKPVLAFFYPNMTPQLLDTAFLLMFYGAFSIILTALMQYFVMLLQANGQFKFIFLITSIGGIFKAVLSFFLASVPGVNIFALVIGNIVLAGTISSLALWKLKRMVAFKIGLWDIFLLLFATLVMFVAVFCFLNFEYFHPILNIILAIGLGVFVYGVISMPFVLKILPSLKNRTLFKKKL